MEKIEESRQHLIAKYGEDGYATQHTYFSDPEFDQACTELRQLLSDPAAFTARYCAANRLTPPTSPR